MKIINKTKYDTDQIRKLLQEALQRFKGEIPEIKSSGLVVVAEPKIKASNLIEGRYEKAKTMFEK